MVSKNSVNFEKKYHQQPSAIWKTNELFVIACSSPLGLLSELSIRRSFWYLPWWHVVIGCNRLARIWNCIHSSSRWHWLRRTTMCWTTLAGNCRQSVLCVARTVSDPPSIADQKPTNTMVNRFEWKKHVLVHLFRGQENLLNFWMFSNRTNVSAVLYYILYGNIECSPQFVALVKCRICLERKGVRVQTKSEHYNECFSQSRLSYILRSFHTRN